MTMKKVLLHDEVYCTYLVLSSLDISSNDLFFVSGTSKATKAIAKAQTRA